MIVVKIEEEIIPATDKSVELLKADFSIGETKGNAFSFVTQWVGALTMPPSAWEQFLKALQRGTRRPMIVMLERASDSYEETHKNR